MTLEERTRLEIDQYLATDVIDSDEDPLKWWSTFGQVIFPTIKRVVKKYLCVCYQHRISTALQNGKKHLHTGMILT